MSKKDKIKTMLDLYKSIILVTLTGSFSVFGYAVLNYDRVSTIKLYGIIAGAILLIIALIVFLYLFLKEVHKLEQED